MLRERGIALYFAKRLADVLPMKTESITTKQAAAILGRLGGKKKSPAKTAACRANAKKPRKRVIVVPILQFIEGGKRGFDLE